MNYYKATTDTCVFAVLGNRMNLFCWYVVDYSSKNNLKYAKKNIKSWLIRRQKHINIVIEKLGQRCIYD